MKFATIKLIIQNENTKISPEYTEQLKSQFFNRQRFGNYIDQVSAYHWYSLRFALIQNFCGLLRSEEWCDYFHTLISKFFIWPAIPEFYVVLFHLVIELTKCFRQNLISTNRSDMDYLMASVLRTIIHIYIINMFPLIWYGFTGFGVYRNWVRSTV